MLFVAAGLLLLTGRADSVTMEWAGPIVAVGLGLLILFAARPRQHPDAAAVEDDLDEAG